MGNSSKDEGDSNKKSKKATGLDEQNNNLVRAARLFCALLSRLCKTSTWNFLISRALFMVEVNAAQKLSFSNIRYGPFGFKSQKISPTFDK